MKRTFCTVSRTLLVLCVLVQTVYSQPVLPENIIKRIEAPILTARGRPKVYQGEHLEAVRLPLGGIGSGCIQINGRAEREIWQIFNNYCEAFVPDSFFAVRVQEGKSDTVVKVLQTKGVGPFEKMDNLSFRGEYPFGWYNFEDESLPVKVAMETFNPLIPFSPKDSAIPCAIFNITAANPTNEPIEVSVLATQKNATGFMTTEGLAWPGPAEEQGVVFADFEGADYGPWTVTGDTFGKKPLQGIMHVEQRLANFKGKGLANSYGAKQDTATGSLTSPEFRIERAYIHFLVGGGAHINGTCINLKVDGKQVASATGKNSDQMEWHTWDVTEWKHKSATIEIVDTVTGGWGHIDIDHIVFSDEPGMKHKSRLVGLGLNRNSIVKEQGACLLKMTTERKNYDASQSQAEAFCKQRKLDKNKYDKGLGDMVLMGLSPQAQGIASWQDAETLHREWLADNNITGPKTTGPSERDKTYNGAISIPFHLKPGESKTVTFVLTWYFPNAVHGGGRWAFKGNMYTNWWQDAGDVAVYVKDNIEMLTVQTRLYHDTLYGSNLPHWLLDRLNSQLAILKSKTFFWAEDGYLGCWEGCSSLNGCCSGNCSHVYHYAQAHARLFPSLARRIREQSLSYQREDGFVTNRDGANQEAIDGMCGEILGAYREHLMSSSQAWLDSHWPRLQKLMHYIIQRWDADGDGMLSGSQHNTLDTEVTGTASWLGSVYLSALGAAEKMALLQEDPGLAKRYRAIRLSGAELQNARLWNGQYYIQIPEAFPKGHNYITGCSIDQVLGEWWAGQLGLDGHYPEDRIRSALRSLLKYNFRCDFHGVKQAPRKFVDDNDAGMQMICWPNPNNRPVKPLYYADEVMTGFEYATAATMVQFGMLEEGLMVTKAIYDRYDGRLRENLTPGNTSSWGYSGNPFGDDECGKFYGRALSVWSLLLASQGLTYDGPAGVLGFQPVWQPEDHRSFVTFAEGWGLFSQQRDGTQQIDTIDVANGSVLIRKLIFELNESVKLSKVRVKVNGQSVAYKHNLCHQDVTIDLNEALRLQAHDSLKVTFTVY